MCLPNSLPQYVAISKHLKSCSRISRVSYVIVGELFFKRPVEKLGFIYIYFTSRKQARQFVQTAAAIKFDEYRSAAHALRFDKQFLRLSNPPRTRNDANLPMGKFT